MHTQFYLVKPLSNLHVGSGDISVGVIDNLIQRDVLTRFPTINSSSLKGALREFCKHNKLTDLEKIFGSDPEVTKKVKGAFRFFEASLLAIPVRTDKVPYLMATSIELLNEFAFRKKQFNGTSDQIAHVQKFMDELGTIEGKKPVVFDKSLENATIEELEFKAQFKEVSELSAINSIIKGELVIFSDEDMRLICDDNHLPVIARNHLENGTSDNLWYEQVLPRYTLLYFAVVSNEQSDFKEFDQAIENVPVSIGANASIGYGYCKISKLG
ncbi:type III-B CRISPR module RAMP protein Cmr4 [Anditalea andensis]|uniref:CRISPR type III-associated protein domain-containing protein n=1 Tax=Anditalea andensis TaxID=1048983 RepID=A0A074L7S9_9BACT|nr:type III-B CRISPR module RAMP protein Cmr4 [Anditalea andensis]KEO75913.1 hypothetical protein EL17_20155 [Anditalea andensis]